MKLIQTFFLFLLCAIQLQAQSDPDNIPGWIASEINMNTDLPIDLSQFDAVWIELKRNPVNLNSPEAVLKEKLLFVPEQVIRAILLHRLRYGDFVSVFELQAVDGLQDDWCQRLRPFVYAGEGHKSAAPGFSTRILLQSARKLKESSEYSKPGAEGGFIGNPWSESIRFQSDFKNGWQAGGGFEKDAGEPDRFLPDFSSAFLYYKGKQRVKSFALGDFKVGFGNGLLAGASSFMGKSAGALLNSANRQGIFPYRSLTESGFMRGMATELNLSKQISLFFWHSALPVSGKFNYDSLSDEEYLVSIQNSGLHRTLRELDSRNLGIFRSTGLGIRFVQHSWWAGITSTASGTLLNKGLVKNYFYGIAAYSKPEISGFVSFKLGTAGFGIEYKLPAGNWLATCIYPFHSGADFFMQFRKYSGAAGTLYSTASAGFSQGSSEKGVMCGVRLMKGRNLTILLSQEIYNTGSGSYRRKIEACGYEASVSLNHVIRKGLAIQTKLSAQRQWYDLNQENMRALTSAEENRIALRTELVHTQSVHIQIKSRVEWQKYLKDTLNPEGMLFLTEITAKPKKGKLALTGGISYFDGNSAHIRFYSREKQLPQNYSLAQLSGNGIRWYVMNGVKVCRRAKFGIRFSQTFVRSGNGKGPEKYAEIAFQLLIRTDKTGDP